MRTLTKIQSAFALTLLMGAMCVSPALASSSPAATTIIPLAKSQPSPTILAPSAGASTKSHSSKSDGLASEYIVGMTVLHYNRVVYSGKAVVSAAKPNSVASSSLNTSSPQSNIIFNLNAHLSPRAHTLRYSVSFVHDGHPTADLYNSEDIPLDLVSPFVGMDQDNSDNPDDNAPPAPKPSASRADAAVMALYNSVPYMPGQAQRDTVDTRIFSISDYTFVACIYPVEQP